SSPSIPEYGWSSSRRNECPDSASDWRQLSRVCGTQSTNVPSTSKITVVVDLFIARRVRAPGKRAVQLDSSASARLPRLSGGAQSGQRGQQTAARFAVC